jgi:hypothetical protein
MVGLDVSKSYTLSQQRNVVRLFLPLLSVSFLSNLQCHDIPGTCQLARPSCGPCNWTPASLLSELSNSPALLLYNRQIPGPQARSPNLLVRILLRRRERRTIHIRDRPHARSIRSVSPSNLPSLSQSQVPSSASTHTNSTSAIPSTTTLSTPAALRNATNGIGPRRCSAILPPCWERCRMIIIVCAELL